MRASPSMMSMVSEQFIKAPDHPGEEASIRSYRANSLEKHRFQSFLENNGRIVSVGITLSLLTIGSRMC